MDMVNSANIYQSFSKIKLLGNQARKAKTAGIPGPVGEEGNGG